MQEPKNTQASNELFSKCLARYDNKKKTVFTEIPDG